MTQNTQIQSEETKKKRSKRRTEKLITNQKQTKRQNANTYPTANVMIPMIKHMSDGPPTANWFPMTTKMMPDSVYSSPRPQYVVRYLRPLAIFSGYTISSTSCTMRNTLEKERKNWFEMRKEHIE